MLARRRVSHALLVMLTCSAALVTNSSTAVTASPQRGGRDCGGQSANPQRPCQEDVDRMMAALPAAAPAKPARPRNVLVLADTQGFVHTSIPLAAATVEALGNKTGAWTTTISYDAKDINTEHLKQYDLVFLDSTTGCFLDEPGNTAETAARRAALLAFVRGGKGLAGVHAATDSYSAPCPGSQTGRGGPSPVQDWPEFNTMIGGIFAAHPWQRVWVKIDDPASPIAAPFKGQPFEMVDETYTMLPAVYSRENVRVLLSVDVSRLSAADQARENRADHDYALSWIRREGKGRVFYSAHGHREAVYAMTPMLEHYLAGIQYALGDLKADDTPSAKK
jgi:uncharacterized protein